MGRKSEKLRQEGAAGKGQDEIGNKNSSLQESMNESSGGGLPGH